MMAALIVLGAGLALPAPLRSMSKDENSEWTKVLAGVSSSQTTTVLSETRPADKKLAKPAGTKNASKEAGSQLAKPAITKAAAKPKAQPRAGSEGVNPPVTISVESEPEKVQPAEKSSLSQTEEVVTVTKSEWDKVIAALEKQSRLTQGPAAEVTKVEVKPSSSAKSEPTATEVKYEEADKSETSQTIAKAENSHVLAPVDDGKNEPPASENQDGGLQSVLNRWKEKFAKVTYGTELERFLR